MPVIQIRHNAQSGSEIHKNVRPLGTEKLISKNDVNSYKDTELLNYLKEHGAKRLVICGMMTHMCVEAAVRATHATDSSVFLCTMRVRLAH